jgi:hypothetical protein
VGLKRERQAQAAQRGRPLDGVIDNGLMAQVDAVEIAHSDHDGAALAPQIRHSLDDFH